MPSNLNLNHKFKPVLLQAPDGTVQLQSAGLPLPDQALRWLTPLPRPLHTPNLAINPHQQAPSNDSPHAEGTDTDMQDAQPPDEQQMQQQVLPQQHQLPQASTPQQAASTDPMGNQHATQAAAANATHAGPSSMEVDNPQHAQSQTASHPQQNVNSISTGSELQDWLQLPAQPVLQPQMILVPADLQDFVLESVKKCDRQLQGRQEEVMVKQVLQRVEQEVRQVQGPQDMDDGAVELVQKVSQFHTLQYPIAAGRLAACVVQCIDVLMVFQQAALRTSNSYLMLMSCVSTCKMLFVVHMQ